MRLAPNAPHLTVPVNKDDHALGPDDAPVALVEYGDYECPHCGRAHPITKAIKKTMGDNLRFVFRHFPLVTLHLHADIAAQAAEAAGAQGRFWEMHDTIFEHQDALDVPSLRLYAQELGLDMVQFDADLALEKYAARVRSDFRAGVRSGVNGTPTFFINGARYNGSYDLRSLLAALVSTTEMPAQRI